MKTNTYRCSKCRRLYQRESARAWMKSFCYKTGKYARLILVKP